MSDIRVIVTGSRDYPTPEHVHAALTAALFTCCGGPSATLTVVHGACPTGADAFAHEWCQQTDNIVAGVLEEPHPADWDTCTPACYHRPRTNPDGSNRCPAAGPRRNTEMVERGADLVLGFPLDGPRSKSRGTYDCMDKAIGVIPVWFRTPSAHELTEARR
ncbi:putative bacteriophage protein [Nocardia nova SH22a]|uniref:Putative bacteriophage protein n=1 Tax=Nocardia nova SH22a TaxID=1415166 RepID=W5TNF1_9NOCA|nr:SLOG family protein [Nocardia nova]AHH20787.1 putative bacteriophage protein [Nocardia nova SH22a]